MFKEVMRPRIIVPLTSIALVLYSSRLASALPSAPQEFCETYPASPSCTSSVPACTFCHTVPPARNAFGAQLSDALLPGAPRPLSSTTFSEGLANALDDIAAEDADGDGVSNLEEILGGTYPGDPTSAPATASCAEATKTRPAFDVCAYDEAYVYAKVLLDFCGISPTLAEKESFAAKADRRAEIHLALDRCLASPAWRGKNGALYRLAHRKIRPVQSIKSGDGPGDVPLGDYDDDYKLFVYSQIDNHDARELLTATYFVETVNGDDSVYRTYTRTPIEDIRARGGSVAQLVTVNRRAGILTTRWNFVLNTMFTAIPRTTAAQAYRAYLGLDIAKTEGLQDVPGEPRDYDRKGVQQPECARCHATLDPLTYPFSRYAGFNGTRSFSYSSTRMIELSEGVDDPLRETPEAGFLFNTPVADLQEWARVAANSDAFAQATVLDYWKLLMREPPRPNEQVEFDAVWRSFRSEHGYGVERMLHDLIETEAYGVP